MEIGNRMWPREKAIEKLTIREKTIQYISIYIYISVHIYSDISNVDSFLKKRYINRKGTTPTIVQCSTVQLTSSVRKRESPVISSNIWNTSVRWGRSQPRRPLSDRCNNGDPNLKRGAVLIQNQGRLKTNKRWYRNKWLTTCNYSSCWGPF